MPPRRDEQWVLEWASPEHSRHQRGTTCCRVAMKFNSKLFLFCACAVILCSVAFAAEEASLECSEAGTPHWLKSSTARQTIVDLINKLFKCAEKSIGKYAKIGATLVADVTSCVSKFPNDFFKCLAKLDVPQKISEIMNEFLATIKCIT
ncbi:uncharacterized protein LOC113216957 [Frankliniella occidentalis]|uniref:Uncharacterized protein LOC113216957 n=1 Tax=Frankliniella occidentalis TaxID=133901 RepID=A0A6J1TGG7_FRAOC|nr:uncharacterized protein LOC113216957 [Frankliniella occidentalis]